MAMNQVRVPKALKEMSPGDIVHRKENYHRLLKYMEQLPECEFDLTPSSNGVGYHVRLRSKTPDLKVVE